MTDLSLNAATRDVLVQLQRTSDLRADTARRLSSGLRVERAEDGPVAFFQAQSLQARVRDLLEAKDRISQASSAVEALLAGLDALEDISDQLKGLALSARGADPSVRQEIAEQFDLLRDQFTALADDVTFSGVNLIGTSSATLTIDPGSTNDQSLIIDATASGANDLGIGTAAADFNTFATDDDINAAVAAVDRAISSIRSSAQSFGGDLAVLQIREDFARDLTQTLDAGAAKLVEADLNVEGARLLSAQVREQIETQTLRVTTQSNQLIASLL